MPATRLAFARSSTPASNSRPASSPSPSAAAFIIVVLYLTVHALLFGPVYRMLVSSGATERDAFLVRVVLYVVFLAPLALVGLVADYARVSAVAGVATSSGQAVARRRRVCA